MHGSRDAALPVGSGAAREAPWAVIRGQAALITIVLLLVHGFVRWIPYTPIWDDSYYLARAACVDRAWWALDAGALKDCWEGIYRSPVMAMLALPWGPVASTLKGIGLCMVSLGALNWSLALATIALMRRLGVSWALLLLATLAVRFDPVAAEATNGAFLVDVPFAWITTLAVLLIPLEAAFPSPGTRASIRRGALWGLIASLGVLGKVTFGYFVIAVFPLVLWLRWRSSGRTAAEIAVGAATVVSLPAIGIWIWRGGAFMDHAFGSAWGSHAPFFSHGQQDALSRLAHLVASTGAGGWIVAGMAVLAAMMAWQRRPGHLIWAPSLILAGYLAISLTSPNADMRFALPVVIGLPFALALAGAGPRALPTPTMLPAAALCAVLTVPTALSFDTGRIEQARLALEKLAAIGVRRATLATSSWRFTPETLWLVQEFDRPRLNGLYIGTLVLDYEDGIPRETSLAKLHQSEAVIFEIPRPTEPDYLNIYSDAYLAAAEAGGTALAEGVPDAFKIFILRPR